LPPQAPQLNNVSNEGQDYVMCNIRKATLCLLLCKCIQ